MLGMDRRDQEIEGHIVQKQAAEEKRATKKTVKFSASIENMFTLEGISAEERGKTVAWYWLSHGL